MPVGDACWKRARDCHCVPTPPERIRATSAAAARAIPPVGLRTIARLMPTARSAGPERTRRAMITFAAR